MEGFKKIIVLQSCDEAEVMDAVLKQREIPHRIRSYHDSALDGIFQISKGWGHIEAPEEYRDEIKEIYSGLPGDIILDEETIEKATDGSEVGGDVDEEEDEEDA